MMRHEEGISTESMTVQARIEALMKTFFHEGRWESIYLFSSEGLLMASYGNSPGHDQENLLEFNFSLINIVQLLDEDMPVKEMVVRGKGGKRLVFSYFKALGEELVLAAVVSGRRGYRRAMGKMVKHIRGME